MESSSTNHINLINMKNATSPICLEVSWIANSWKKWIFAFPFVNNFQTSVSSFFVTQNNWLLNVNCENSDLHIFKYKIYKNIFFNLNSITYNIISYHYMKRTFLFVLPQGNWSPFYYQVVKINVLDLTWSCCDLVSWPLLNITNSPV